MNISYQHYLLQIDLSLMNTITKVFRCPKFNYSSSGSQNSQQGNQPQTLINQVSQIQAKQLNDKMDLQNQQAIIKQIGRSISTTLPQQEAKIIIDQINRMIVYFSNNSKILQQQYPQTKLTAESVRQQLQEIIFNINKFTQQSNNLPQSQILERRNFLSEIRTFITNHPTNKNLQSDKYDKLVFIVLFTLSVRNMFNFFIQFQAPPELLKQNPQFMKNIQLIDYNIHDQLQIEHNKLQKSMDYLAAITVDSANNSSSIFGNFKICWDIAKASMSYKKSQLKSLQLYYMDDFPNIIRHLGLADQNPLKAIVGKMLPNITSNVMIYIPLHQEQQADWNLFKQSENAIPVRILYYNHLPFTKQSKLKEGQTLNENIMFHMHGGGFISLSSFGVQGYTRVWANQTKMIIFSIDYTLATKHPFPRAVEDCQRVYEFMMRKGCALLKINPKGIFIGGDSAGGNLTCSLTALILKNNLPKPNGLMLIYPFLDSRRIFYGSRRLFIGDILLWPSIASLFIKTYAIEHDHQVHPLASPVLLTEGYISGNIEDKRFPQDWPTTYIHIGSQDPLKDQCFLLMQRMIEAKIPCKCTLVAELKHGYMLTSSVIKSAKQTIKDTVKSLIQLMELTKKEI